MAYSTPAGTSFYISQTFATAVAVTAATNANPAVITAASHGLVDNDEIVYFSGWGLANQGVFRADMLTTDTAAVLGLNSANTNRFSPSGGVGTIREISGWIELPQVLTIQPSGGDIRTITVNPIKLPQGIVLPDGINPATNTFTLGHDVGLPNWSTLLDISRGQTLVAYKSVKGNGAATYGYGYFIMGEQANQASGQVDTINAVFLAQGPLISYA